MNQYLLSVYELGGQGEDTPPAPEEMRAFMGRVIALEEEMDRAGAFAFGGALHGPDATTVGAPLFPSTPTTAPSTQRLGTSGHGRPAPFLVRSSGSPSGRWTQRRRSTSPRPPPDLPRWPPPIAAAQYQLRQPRRWRWDC